MSTLLLDTVVWDFLVDASGNLASAEAPYALAQDAASAIKLFQQELWYDTTQGLPYFQKIYGQALSLAAAKADFVNAALTVPGVTAAVCFITGFDDRGLHGQVQVTDRNGVISVAGF